MRCFIAIDLSEEAKKELASVQRKLPDAKMTLVKPEIIHLTLKFLGEISDEELNKVKEALSKLKLKKFEAKLGDIGFFPSEQFIRVVWADIGPKEKLLEIFDLVEEALSKRGFSKEKKPFESHATLARIKFIKNKKEYAEKLNKIKIKTAEFTIDKVILKKSELTQKGPVYEDLFAVELG